VLQSYKNRAKLTPTAGIVDRIIGSLGLTRQYYGWQMVSQWPEIVGEFYALKTRAFRFDDGILYVAVEDASWRQQLSLDTRKILDLIHSFPHGDVVTDLRLVMGEKGTRTDGN
jgi:hypothetical protein